MQRLPSRQPIAAAALAAALLAGGCGEKPEPELASVPSTTVPAPSATTTGTAGAAPARETGQGGGGRPPREPKPHGPAESGNADPRLTAIEREAGAAVRRYVAALDARDARAICATLAPGVAGQVEPPAGRGDACASIAASVGYRDPRGLPVWRRARVAEVRSIAVDGSVAKVVATVVTEFADRDEPSIEDDIVYLTRRGGRWYVAKPSSTLYRSIGVADVPPSVLSPPR
jgi:hypothetical protein